MKEVVNAKILFHLCYVDLNYIHFPLGNYLGTSLMIGNFVITRVTSVEWTRLGLERRPA